MGEHVVLYEKKANVALLTFNRPGALNALNTEVNLKLIDLLLQAENDEEVRVVVRDWATSLLWPERILKRCSI